MQTEKSGRPQAMIAMSGGVDSSVAAYLMQQAGYDCMGVTMKLYENEDAGVPRGHTCCALDDVEDARRVAYALGMPYYVFNYKDAFREQVMARFAAAYQHGATPNPCLDCNRYLKFGLLETRARALGCDVLATGHYARIEQLPDGRWTLKKAADPEKDQSYVLAWLTQEQLAHTRLPLGEFAKSDTRRIAEECRTPRFATRFQKNLRAMVRDFAAIPVTDEPRLKVGIVGEIYAKYSPLANNHLEEFLRSQDCEVNVPGLMGFMLFKVDNRLDDIQLYGGNPLKKFVVQALVESISRCNHSCKSNENERNACK